MTMNASGTKACVANSIITVTILKLYYILNETVKSGGIFVDVKMKFSTMGTLIILQN